MKFNSVEAFQAKVTQTPEIEVDLADPSTQRSSVIESNKEYPPTQEVET
jgi:hypothetical protein